MKKKLFFAAIALTTLAGCTDESYVGDQSLLTNETGAISFNMKTPAITRATDGAAATALDNKFKVYGVKKVGDDYSNVFATNTYSASNNTPYWVWYVTSTAGTTTSNTKNWEYVGTGGGVVTPALDPAQTIKYWDYSASQYEFVAYSATIDGPTITNYQKDGFTVAATAAQLAGLYVADKLTITDKNSTPSMPASGSATVNKIGDVVQLTFRSSATKVRLGIYETINGYVVRNVKFRPNASEFTTSTTNAILTGQFNGSSSNATGTYNVTYASSVPQMAIFTRKSDVEFRASYFDFGTFASTTSIGTTSTAPTWAGAIADPSNAPYYQSVLPNTDNVGDMILYVDYELYNSVSGETIHVYGAKAVVPSIYMKWNPNYAYTYLFKISDNTNGTTSTTVGTPTGLFPITFDAVTVATTDGAQVGTITTVSSPAITTYQAGSVSDAGITYAHANGAIYITVNTDGSLATLSSDNTKLYTVENGTTEADLMLTTKTKSLITSGDDALDFFGTDETSQGIVFTTGKAVKFTPTASTTYAIEYNVSPAVPASYTEVTGLTEDVSDVTGLYERSGSSEPYTYTLTENTTAQSGKTYYRYNPAIPAGYKYKIIEVGSGS